MRLLKHLLLMSICTAQFVNVNALNGTTVITPQSNSSSSGSGGGLYYYYYHGQRLQDALQIFARNNNKTIVFSPDLSSKLLSKPVIGKFAVDSNTNFLDTMAQQYGFNWFEYSGIIHITSNKTYSKAVSVSPDNMPSVKSALDTQNLLNPKFGYSELPGQNKVVISGPKPYINVVSSKLQSFSVAPIAQQFAVYHLKYANATDLQLTFNNQNIVIPGVATILRNIFSGGDTSNLANNPLTGRVLEPLVNKAKNIVAQGYNGGSGDTAIGDGNSDDNSSGGGASHSSGGMLSKPTIQADQRLNTIIIRDKQVNLNIYKEVIALLDVPAPMIQIQVLAVNINLDLLRQAGINWWGSYNNASTGFGAANLNNNGVSNNLSINFGQISPGQLVVNNLNKFISSLQFLEQNGYAQTLTEPTVVTIDNLPGIMSSNENVYTASPVTPGGSNNNQNSSSNQVQVLNSLAVTPHLIFDKNNQRFIKMAIILNDGEILSQSQNAQYPDTIQNTINSQAIVKDGQSLLLAGYSHKSREEHTNKVPILGDIPLLGWFFKSKTNEVKNYTTIYLLTPKVYWLSDMVKLKDYTVVGGHKVNLSDDDWKTY